jgi:methionyl-tRNA formyltransferase
LNLNQKNNMSPIIPKELKFAFFGTPEFAAITLDELEQKGFIPKLIITTPDKPKGRKLVLTPSEVKVWAEVRGIPVLTPTKLRDEHFIEELKAANCVLYIVAAYGKIIPSTVLDMPTYHTLNVHPSLLPKFRGASPIESAIRSSETQTGVTIMLLDEELDHGAILAQGEAISLDLPPRGSELTHKLAHEGGELLAEIIPKWIAGELTATPQDHTQATFTKKIEKEDGLIDLADDAMVNYKKIRAYDQWPGTYFFTERNGKQIRVRITDATIVDDRLHITSVIPEGKKEMRYEDFLRGMKT